jgi:hypothetical protein
MENLLSAVLQTAKIAILKGHLGNVRMVLTDEHRAEIYPTLSMEGSVPLEYT